LIFAWNWRRESMKLPHMLTMVSLCGDRVKICVLTICFAYFRCIPLRQRSILVSWWLDEARVFEAMTGEVKNFSSILWEDNIRPVNNTNMEANRLTLGQNRSFENALKKEQAVLDRNITADAAARRNENRASLMLPMQDQESILPPADLVDFWKTNLENQGLIRSSQHHARFHSKKHLLFEQVPASKLIPAETWATGASRLTKDYSYL
jgi:hypothetical protein